MTISRGQMNRQLYMGGGIMNVVPREKALFGGIKKAVKKVTKGVKKIASSDIGKAALAYGLTAGLGSLGAGKGFGSLLKGSTYLPSNVLGNLGIAGTNLAGALGFGGEAAANKALAAAGSSDYFGGPTSIFKGGKMGTIGKLATLGAVSTFLTKTAGMSPEQAEEAVESDPSTYLELYYRNLNPPTADTNSEEYEKQVRDFVAANTSEYAQGGRIMKAEGDTASDNAMQAAGIEGLPIRQNPKGVKELDLRENGGFIPPVGIKEKEDDIPAMLSNNEFVFTADAVRGMGDGNVDLGAQRMYDMMKKLEGKVVNV